jgi:hypothetical protein
MRAKTSTQKSDRNATKSSSSSSPQKRMNTSDVLSTLKNKSLLLDNSLSKAETIQLNNFLKSRSKFLDDEIEKMRVKLHSPSVKGVSIPASRDQINSDRRNDSNNYSSSPNRQNNNNDYDNDMNYMKSSNTYNDNYDDNYDNSSRRNQNSGRDRNDRESDHNRGIEERKRGTSKDDYRENLKEDIRDDNRKGSEERKRGSFPDYDWENSREYSRGHNREDDEQRKRNITRGRDTDNSKIKEYDRVDERRVHDEVEKKGGNYDNDGISRKNDGDKTEDPDREHNDRKHVSYDLRLLLDKITSGMDEAGVTPEVFRDMLLGNHDLLSYVETSPFPDL